MRYAKMTVLQVALIATAVTAVHGAPGPLEILRQSILARTRVDFSGIRTVVIFENGEKVHGVEQKIDCDAPGNLRIVVIEPQNQGPCTRTFPRPSRSCRPGLPNSNNSPTA